MIATATVYIDKILRWHIIGTVHISAVTIIAELEGKANNLDTQVAERLYIMYMCPLQSITDTSLVALKSYL